MPDNIEGFHMLPFLKKNNEASVSAPVDSVRREHDEDHEYDPMDSAIEELFDAIHKKDIRAGKEAFMAAMELYDSGPHEEGEHE